MLENIEWSTKNVIFCTQLRPIAHFYYQWLSILSTLKIREGEKLMMSVAISAWKRCSVRLCLQLFVGELQFPIFITFEVMGL
jgi:hypothetical protein